MGPPPIFAGSAGQIHELSGLLLTYLVKLAEIAYIAQADTACTSFNSADLSGRAHKQIRDLADGELLPLTEPPQAHTQVALADRRLPFFHH
jgi:hypothetical protein